MKSDDGHNINTKNKINRLFLTVISTKSQIHVGIGQCIRFYYKLSVDFQSLQFTRFKNIVKQKLYSKGKTL